MVRTESLKTYWELYTYIHETLHIACVPSTVNMFVDGNGIIIMFLLIDSLTSTPVYLTVVFITIDMYKKGDTISQRNTKGVAIESIDQPIDNHISCNDTYVHADCYI